MAAKPVKLRLADVAERAGVSEATVSRVVNDRPGVSTATRNAVLTAIDVLGIDPPSRMRPRAGALIGLIVPELSNPIFPAFAQTIENGLALRGFTPVLCTQTPGGVHEDIYVPMLLDRGVAGIIFISGQHADSGEPIDRYLQLEARGLPMVLVNGVREGVAATCISNDDEAATEYAVTHLLELGHTAIGLILGPAQYVPVRQRDAAFRRRIAAELPDTDLDAMIVNTFYSVEGGAFALRTLVGRGATAVICASDMMALGAIRQARRMGLDVPGDVSVIGYDDSLLMSFTDPPLTTLRQNVLAMSDAIVHALLAEIGGTPARHAEFLFPPELVVRGSTGRVSGSARASGSGRASGAG